MVEPTRFTLKTDRAMEEAIEYIMKKKGITKKTAAIRYALTITQALLVFEEILKTNIEDLTKLKIEELKKKLNALELSLEKLQK